MKKSYTEWLDIFRFYVFVCFEENDGDLKILANAYNEGGLGLNFYNGIIKEVNIEAYEALFKTLQFLSLKELCALKNIIQANDYYVDEDLNILALYRIFCMLF